MEEIMIAEKLNEMELNEIIEVFMRLKIEDPDALYELKEILDDIIQVKNHINSTDIFNMSRTILWPFQHPDKI